MPAVPAIIGAGGSIVGGLLGHKASQQAQQRSPEEQALLNSQTQAINQGRQQSAQMFGSAMPAINQTLGYYRALLGGNRAQMGLATAGARGSIADTYKGATRGLVASGVRGGVLDQAKADLARDRTRAIAGLTSGVQPMAAQGLAGTAAPLVSGTIANNAAGLSATNALLGNEMQNRQIGQQAGQQTGAGVGALIADLLSAYGGRGGSGGAASLAPLYSRSTAPTLGYLPG